MLGILLLAAITAADLDNAEQVQSERVIPYFAEPTLNYVEKADVRDIYHHQVNIWHQCVQMVIDHFDNTNTDMFLIISAAFDNCAKYQGEARATYKLIFDWEGLDYGSRTAHADDEVNQERERLRQHIIDDFASRAHH
jgi:hypothetical protein